MTEPKKKPRVPTPHLMNRPLKNDPRLADLLKRDQERVAAAREDVKTTKKENEND